MKKINIGLIGFGKIGSGVVKALQSKRAFLKDKSGVDINIVKICDKDIKSKRPVKVSRSILTKSLGDVLYNPDIHIVVELMGGIKPAKDVVLEYREISFGSGIRYEFNRSIEASLSVGDVINRVIKYKNTSDVVNIDDGLYTEFKVAIKI